MRRALKAMLACLAFTGVHAQAPIKELRAVAGFCIPTGDFASSSFSNDKAGFAKDGIAYRLTYQQQVNKHLAILFILGGSRNLIDLSLPGVSIERRYWTTLGGQVGLAGLLPVNDRLTLEAHVSGGLTRAGFGGMHIRDAAGNEIEQKQASCAAYIYSIGAGAKFYVSERIFIPVLFDFSACEGTFIGVSTMRNGVLIDHSDFRNPMRTFNASLGVGFRL